MVSPTTTVEHFTPRLFFTTAPTVHSAPVPAVLGMLIIGKVPPLAIANFRRNCPNGRCECFALAAMILELSMTDPPPRATMQSALQSIAAWRPALTMSTVGSELIEWNRV